MILKSPVPEIPADFTGGFVKINTKDTPGELPFAPLLLDRVQHGDLRPRLSLQSGKRQRLVRAATTASAACGVVLRVLLITTIRISLPT